MNTIAWASPSAYHQKPMQKKQIEDLVEAFALMEGYTDDGVISPLIR